MKRHLKRLSLFLIAFVFAASFAPMGLTDTAEASTYYYFNSPKQNAKHKTGDKVKVSFYCGPEIKTTYPDGRVEYRDMPVTLKVFKGKKKLYTKKLTYKRTTTLKTRYTPKTTGTLTLRLYALPYGLGQTEQILHDTVTIKVTKRKASDVKKIKPAITVRRTAKKKAVISCSNSSGFGMKVYRATKKNGKYKRIKTTKKSSFTDKKLSASKVYYYKVRLYAKSNGKSYKSKWSKIKKARKYKKPRTPVERPVITSVKKVSDGSGDIRHVRITWKRFDSYSKSNVDFFFCRKSPGDGAYTPLEGDPKPVWKDKTIYITDKNAVKGKTYIYNVYASSKVKDYMCDTLKPVRYKVP